MQPSYKFRSLVGEFEGLKLGFEIVSDNKVDLYQEISTQMCENMKKRYLMSIAIEKHNIGVFQ